MVFRLVFVSVVGGGGGGEGGGGGGGGGGGATRSGVEPVRRTRRPSGARASSRATYSPGASAGVLIWILASIGFFFYVSNFGSYGATYGAFAGAVILLLWLYISSIAFLFGAEINAELEREQAAPSRVQEPPAQPQWPALPADAPDGVSSDGGGSGRVDDKYGRDALAR